MIMDVVLFHESFANMSSFCFRQLHFIVQGWALSHMPIRV